MARKTAVEKYLAETGRKGGNASSQARMEKLTPAQTYCSRQGARRRPMGKARHPNRSEAAIRAAGRRMGR
jgi:hypothetical protein